MVFSVLIIKEPPLFFKSYVLASNHHKSISVPMRVNYERVICHSAGSPPSLPRPSHPPQWASDGEEPSPYFSIRSDVSLISEKEMLTPSINHFT